MNLQKIRKIEDRITKNKLKLTKEKNIKKKQILRLRIKIDKDKISLERLL
jgi:hypothetical protein